MRFDEASIDSLSDDELLEHFSLVVRSSRRIEAVLVATVAEVDHRRLYLREACSSMFSYCTEMLHLSESEAYPRISVARDSSASDTAPDALQRKIALAEHRAYRAVSECGELRGPAR